MNSRSRSLCHRPSVCLSSVTFVHPTQAIKIFGNVSVKVRRPSRPIDIQVKFSERPRGTPPSGELRELSIGIKNR